jgi:hypothetical protein
MPIDKRHKLGRKIMDCVFLGYAHHSIACRFLGIKSEVYDIYVNTFLEFHDVTFFDNIFLRKIYIACLDYLQM